MKGYKSGARTWAVILVIALGLVAFLVIAITQVTGGSGANPSTGTGTNSFHVAVEGPEYGDQYQRVEITALSPLKSGTTTRAQVIVRTFSEAGKQVSKEADPAKIQQISWNGSSGKIRLIMTDSTSTSASTLDFMGSKVEADGELAETGCKNWSRVPVQPSKNQPALTAARSLTCRP